MKRNFYFCFIVLFILSACQPSPGGQGQAATAMQTKTSTVKPTATLPPTATPTPEIVYKPNANMPKVDLVEFDKNYEKYIEAFPVISFDEILSGKLLEQEQKYIQENNTFGDNIFQSNLFLNWLVGFGSDSDGGTFDPLFVDLDTSMTTHTKPETRPFSILSFYRIKDFDSFAKGWGINTFNNDRYNFGPFGAELTNEKVQPIMLVTYKYHNRDGQVTLIHSLIDIVDYIFLQDAMKNGRLGMPKGSEMYPIFNYGFRKVTMPEENIKKWNPYITYFVYKTYPELMPDENYVNEWINTEQMPIEIQKFVFQTRPNSIFIW